MVNVGRQLRARLRHGELQTLLGLSIVLIPAAAYWVTRLVGGNHVVAYNVACGAFITWMALIIWLLFGSFTTDPTEHRPAGQRT